MNKFVILLDRVLSACLISFMLIIVLTVTWQVLARYIFHASSPGSEELARFLLIWIGLLGSVYCYRTQMHLGLDIIIKKMSMKRQNYTKLLSHALVLCFALSVLVLGGSNLVHLTFNPVQTSAALNIEMGYVYGILPLSGVLFCFYASIEIYNLLLNTSNEEVITNGN